VRVPESNEDFALYASDPTAGSVHAQTYEKGRSDYTIQYLKSLLSATTGRVLLIWDQAKWHTSKKVRRISYGKKANQRLHQWAYGEFARMIKYKARLHGMTVKRVGEAYTSQTCPSCGNRKKPNGREYTCSCGFKGHRDIVGAANIRQKYLGPDVGDLRSLGPLRVAGEGPVRSDMASPTGVRYKPHMSCNPLSGRRPRVARKTPSGAATVKRERAA